MSLETNEIVDFNELNGKEILVDLYNKELNSKKTVLECIKVIKENKESLNEEKMQEVYNVIYSSIEGMSNLVKPNTIMYLKNQLKADLGKLVKEKDPKKINHFIEFFKEAYPAGQRRKGFTWVLMDINKITEEQIWETLTYINAWHLKDRFNRLASDQKKDIIEMVEVLVNRGKIKYINNLKSLEKLQRRLGIEIVQRDNKFKVKKIDR
ncbi:hypothetical protein [Clostridium sp.]|uniref:hypothetical protein n=1 Tax=Clostridium sp. TaxID=1506 RepID=UPI003F2ABD30